MEKFNLHIKKYIFKKYIFKFLGICLVLFLLSPANFPKNNDNKIPGNYELSQNYPNPFNPSTRISYSIPKETFVEIKIYNMLGNEVALLVNEEQKAGTYSITFNASNLPSGVYFYRLQADNFTITKKLTVLK